MDILSHYKPQFKRPVTKPTYSQTKTPYKTRVHILHNSLAMGNQIKDYFYLIFMGLYLKLCFFDIHTYESIRATYCILNQPDTQKIRNQLLTLSILQKVRYLVVVDQVRGFHSEFRQQLVYGSMCR